MRTRCNVFEGYLQLGKSVFELLMFLSDLAIEHGLLVIEVLEVFDFSHQRPSTSSLDAQNGDSRGYFGG